MEVASWLSAAPLPMGRLNHCLAASSTALYVIGGYTFPPPQYMSSVLRGDGASPWTEMPPMIAPRDSFGCGVVGDDTLVAAGGESIVTPFMLSAVETLNLSSKDAKWRKVANLHNARQGHSAAVLGGLLYVAGGIDANGAVQGSVEAFNATTNLWNRGPSLRVPRTYHGLAASLGSLYAIGGRNGTSDSLMVLSSVEAFTVSGGGWREVAPMPEARERMAVATSLDGAIYVVGGCPAQRVGHDAPCDVLLDSVLIFTPPGSSSSSSSNSNDGVGVWTRAPSVPNPNAWLGAAFLGSNLFAVGGGLFYGRNETYQLAVA